MRRPDRIPTDVSRRTIIRGTTAGLFALSGIGTAAAHDEEEKEEEGSTEESEEGDGGEEPTANVTFSDQTVANNDGGPTVTVDRLEMDEGGYQSIHRYSRFQFADGEDPEDYDVPVPDELDNPVCESLIGITEYLEPDVHTNLEVPLFRSNSPAVKLGAASVGPLDESQVMIAIPHHNTTDEDTFNCPDDPSTPDLFKSGDEVDGAFQNGGRDVGDIGVVHDLATVLVDTDDREQKETAKREEELIRAGVLVPQPVVPDEEAEDESEADDEKSEEEKVEDEDEREEQENEKSEDEGFEDEEKDNEREDEEERENEEKDEDEKARDGDDERKRDDESESDEEEDASSADGDDGEKRKAADGSSDRKGRNELPKQASDRARDARKDAPGFDG